MGQPAAKAGDRVVGMDVHIVLPPAPVPPVALPHPFDGVIQGGVSTNVMIMGKPAAVVGSTATNTPPHLPTAPGTAFQRPPSNLSTIKQGSATVKINGKPAARSGDPADTCNDPQDVPAGTVVAAGTVMIG
ncbi:PAAR domain-containing protein [Dactylosporangium sp. NPDC051485]|uniref:PAAR domain-containing protein n=1 Tax=Dactylosporangium sp. NPDC051485 TaxID=3154846 RepID=UPI003420515F